MDHEKQIAMTKKGKILKYNGHVCKSKFAMEKLILFPWQINVKFPWQVKSKNCHGKKVKYLAWRFR